jgi:hypothetical protein
MHYGIETPTKTTGTDTMKLVCMIYSCIYIIKMCSMSMKTFNSVSCHVLNMLPLGFRCLIKQIRIIFSAKSLSTTLIEGIVTILITVYGQTTSIDLITSIYIRWSWIFLEIKYFLWHRKFSLQEVIRNTFGNFPLYSAIGPSR